MARYYQSKDQEFVSQFVPENLQFQQNYYDNMQKNQDAKTLALDSLKTTTDALNNDVPNVIAKKKQIEDLHNSVNGINWNDPNQSRQGMQTIAQIRKELDPLSGSIGVPDKKKKDFDAQQKLLEERYKNNPIMLSYQMDNLRKLNLAPDKAVYFDPATGAPKNTQIEMPKEFNYVNVADWAMAKVNEVTPEQVIENMGLTPAQKHEAILTYQDGTDKYRVQETMESMLMSSAIADPNVFQSAMADSHQFGGDPKERVRAAFDAAKMAKSAHEKKRDQHYMTDEEYMLGLKHKQEDLQIPITSFAQRAGEGSKFKTPDSFKEKYDELSNSNNNIVLNASNYKDANGLNVLMPSQIKLLKLAGEGNKNISLTSFAANPAQLDLIKGYLSDINQNNVIADNARKQEQRAKEASGLNKNWSASKEAINAGNKAYQNKINEIVASHRGEPGFKITQGMVDIANDAKSDAIKKIDPAHKKYQEFLDKNSKESTETLGLTSISSTSLQNTLSSIIERDLTTQGALGAKDFKTGTQLDDKQYAEIGKVDPKSIGYYFEKGEPRLVVRPEVAGDKSGKKMDYIDMKAPFGVKEHILHNGTLTEKQLAASSILDDAKVDSPQYLENGVSIRKLSNTDISVAPNARNYEVSYKGQVKNYSKQEAIALLTQ